MLNSKLFYSLSGRIFYPFASSSSSSGYFRFLPQLENAKRNFSLSSIAFQALKVNITYKDIDKSKYDALLDENAAKRAETRSTIDDILQLYEYRKYENGRVPSDLSLEQMRDLIAMSRESERESYLRYLFITESRRIRDRAKRDIKSSQLKRYIAERPDRILGIFDQHNELDYRLWGNAIMGRIGSRNVTRHRVERALRHAALFGQKLLIDLDYDDYMSLTEARIQIRHIVYLMAENITRPNPFDIFFTNCDHAKITMRGLTAKYAHMTPFAQLDWRERFCAKSYLDCFDPERLVYLTPDAPDALPKYSHDDIYIIGAFNDKSSLNKPISHLKATKEGIRQYRLPLDEYVSWGSGSSKHLCIMHMVAILDSLKEGADWRTALYENIPRRKVKAIDVVMREDERNRVEFLRRKLRIEKDFFNLNKMQQKQQPKQQKQQELV